MQIKIQPALSLFVLWLLAFDHAFAQYPQYFLYDDENGLPSNEVYSIIQDPEGFIWVAGDNGLYKYDGTRYRACRSAAQKSKSITGLCFSSSGRLYCYNFQSQLFFADGDSLREIPHSFTGVSNIITDHTGNVFVNHSQGLSVYNENDLQWKSYREFGEKTPFGNRLYTKSAKVNAHNQVYFLNTSGMGIVESEKLRIAPSKIFVQDPPGNFVMECVGDNAWIFSVNKNLVYCYRNNKVEPQNRPGLLNAIRNRKITNVRWLKDGKLWICTYTGIVRYDIKQDQAEILYPNFSFSDVLLDREDHYWMSTLQAGLLRIANLRHVVWNGTSKNMPGEKITRVALGGSKVFFATVNGYTGLLDTLTGEIKTFHTGQFADVQCLTYDKFKNEAYFSINNNLYALKNDQVRLVQDNLPPVKSVLVQNETYYLATSFGTYVLTEGKKQKALQISPVWSRALVFDTGRQELWAATNSGLMCFVKKGEQWSCSDTVLKNIQVLGLDHDTIHDMLYAVCFDGKIQAIDAARKVRHITTLPASAQVYQLKLYHSHLFTATNKGVWFYNLSSKKWRQVNRYSGLASDNVQHLQVINGNIWLATGKGLQVLRPPYIKGRALPLVYIRGIRINDRDIRERNNVSIAYGQVLRFRPEASVYNGNGSFKYAYRLKNSGNGWNTLPGNTEWISVLNLPSGPFHLELKVIDHLGRDSQHLAHLTGYVRPPFWKTAWFVILCSLLFVLMAYVIFRQRIKVLRKKQIAEIERLNMENDLRLTQQTALRAQMNPHFIFNVLNSIKGYIYKNDKQKASEYLGSFSDLIRMMLDASGTQYTSLEDELKMLELYIGLESMLLGHEFSYEIKVEVDKEIYQLSIPSMIIQPYVENAFKHGLRHQQGNKHLLLNVSCPGESSVVIEITDNGIGRKASGALQQNKNNHRSFATGAIERRLALINREGSRQVSVKIKDLYDAQGKVSGTSVILTIDLK